MYFTRALAVVDEIVFSYSDHFLNIFRSLERYEAALYLTFPAEYQKNLIFPPPPFRKKVSSEQGEKGKKEKLGTSPSTLADVLCPGGFLTFFTIS